MNENIRMVKQQVVEDQEIKFICNNENERNNSLIEKLENQLYRARNETSSLKSIIKDLEKRISVVEVEKIKSASENKDHLEEIDTLKKYYDEAVEQLKIENTSLQKKVKDLSPYQEAYKCIHEQKVRQKKDGFEKDEAAAATMMEKSKFEKVNLTQIKDVQNEKEKLIHELEELITDFDNESKLQIAQLQQRNIELKERINNEKVLLLEKIEMIEDLQINNDGEHSFDEYANDSEEDDTSDIDTIFKDIFTLRKGFKSESMEYIPLLHSQFAKVELETNKIELSLIEVSKRMVEHQKNDKKQTELIKHLTKDIRALESSCTQYSREQMLVNSTLNELIQVRSVCEEKFITLQKNLDKCMMDIKKLNKFDELKSSQLLSSYNSLKETKICADDKIKLMSCTIQEQASCITILEQDLSDLTTKIQVLKKSESLFKQRLCTVEERCQSAQIEINALNEERDDLKTALTSAQQEILHLGEKTLVLEVENQIYPKLYEESNTTLQGEINELRQEVTNIELRFMDENEQREKCIAENTLLIEQMEVMSTKLRMSEELYSQRTIDLQNAQELLQSKVLEIQDKTEKALESERLNHKLQIEMEHLNKHYNENLQKLEIENQLLETKLSDTQKRNESNSNILRELVSSQTQVMEMLETISEHEKHLIQSQAFLNESKKKCATMEATKQRLEQSLLSYKDEINILMQKTSFTQEEIHIMTQEKESLLLTINKLESKIVEYKTKLLDLELQMKQIIERNEVSEMKSICVGAKNKELEEKLNSHQQENTKYKERIKVLQESIHGYERQITELNSALVMQKKKIALYDEEKNNNRIEYDRKIQEINADHLESLSQLSNVEAENKELQELIAQYQSKVHDLNSTVSKMEEMSTKSNEEKSKQKQELDETIKDLCTQNLKYNSQITKLKFEKNELQQSVKQYEGQVKQLNFSLEEIQETMNASQTRKQREQNELHEKIKDLNVEHHNNLSQISVLEAKLMEQKEIQAKYDSDRRCFEKTNIKLEKTTAQNKKLEKKLKIIHDEMKKIQVLHKQDRIKFKDENLKVKKLMAKNSKLDNDAKELVKERMHDLITVTNLETKNTHLQNLLSKSNQEIINTKLIAEEFSVELEKEKIFKKKVQDKLVSTEKEALSLKVQLEKVTTECSTLIPSMESETTNELVEKVYESEIASKQHLNILFYVKKLAKLCFFGIVLLGVIIGPCKHRNTMRQHHELINFDSQLHKNNESKNGRPFSVFIDQDSITIYNEQSFMTYVLSYEKFDEYLNKKRKSKEADDFNFPPPLRLLHKTLRKRNNTSNAHSFYASSYLFHDDDEFLLEIREEKEKSIQAKNKKEEVNKKKNRVIEEIFDYIVHVL